jgi:heat shock protein HslJ
MDGRALLIAMLFALLFAGCAGTIPQEPVACTMEAKLCPDGTTVGRVPPDCEFAPCPASGGDKGAVSGGNDAGGAGGAGDAGTAAGNADVGYLLAHKWNLVSINGEAIGENPVYIVFNGNQGTFGADAGCNYMNGAYTLDGDQIEFGQTAITLMYCEGRMDLESKVLGVIGGGPYTWGISGNMLTFYKGGEGVAAWEGQAG